MPTKKINQSLKFTLSGRAKKMTTNKKLRMIISQQKNRLRQSEFKQRKFQKKRKISNTYLKMGSTMVNKTLKVNHRAPYNMSTQI